MTDVLNLPDWLEVKSNGTVHIYTSLKYPKVMEELNLTMKDLDRYWLSVIKSITVYDTRTELGRAGLKPFGGTRKFKGPRDGSYRPANYPYGPKWPKDAEGKPIEGLIGQRLIGGDARDYFKRLRGFKPA